MAAFGDQGEDGEAPGVSQELARELEGKQGGCTRKASVKRKSDHTLAVERSSTVTIGNCPVDKQSQPGALLPHKDAYDV